MDYEYKEWQERNEITKRKKELTKQQLTAILNEISLLTFNIDNIKEELSHTNDEDKNKTVKNYVLSTLKKINNLTMPFCALPSISNTNWDDIY